MKTKKLQCPYYSKMSCAYVDTSGMIKTMECENCDYFDKGIRPTGKMPIFGLLIENFNKLIRKRETRKTTYCDSCGHQNEEICNTCTLFNNE